MLIVVGVIAFVTGVIIALIVKRNELKEVLYQEETT